MERLAPEQHDTLDGIPEPAENANLFGHDEAAKALVAAYRAGRLPHALLFAGPKGIGKATLAFHMTYHLLSHRSHERAPEELTPPDPASALFRQIANGAHPSVLHLTRPANDKTKGFKSVVTVDEIRRVNRFLAHTSHDGGYRIVIVDPADDMNTSAANALLKNLEEPPARTVFILITHSPGRLLPTIRSRCQVVRLMPLSEPDLFSVLGSFDIAFSQDAAEREKLVAGSSGSPRAAVVLTQYGGLEIVSALDQIVAARSMSVREAHKLAEAVGARDRSIPFGVFNDHIVKILADAATAASGQGDIGRAAKLSQTCQELRIAINEAETYNLDRKQHALNMILRLHDTLRM